jgi:uncharacterized membrane protein
MITVAGRWLQVRFGTWVLPVVGRLAVLGRLAATTITAGRSRGCQRRVTHRVVLTVAELPGSYWEKDVR